VEELGDITSSRENTLFCNTLIYWIVTWLRFGRPCHKIADTHSVLCTNNGFHVRRGMVLQGNFWGQCRHELVLQNIYTVLM
jgi:hypothetical protein